MYIFLLVFLTFTNISSNCDSIWDRHNPRYAYLFQDNNARRIGDLITIIIDETTILQEQDKRELGKNSGANAELTFGNTNNPIQLLTTDNRYTFNGNAANTANHAFTDKLTAVVIDILPNNNLVIEGYKRRIISGEERIIYITGIIRSADIRVGNTITTDKIANLRIYYLGRGIISRSYNPNYFNRLLYQIWPW
jgi:flagellar L-ring protein precursor FlgH